MFNGLKLKKNEKNRLKIIEVKDVRSNKKKYKNIKMEKGTSEQANERASNEQLHQINTNLFCNYKQEINKRASER